MDLGGHCRYERIAWLQANIQHMVLTESVPINYFRERPPVLRSSREVVPKGHSNQPSCGTIWKFRKAARERAVPPASYRLKDVLAESGRIDLRVVRWPAGDNRIHLTNDGVTKRLK